MRQSGDKQSWANASHTLGRYLYQSFDDGDYQEYLSGPRERAGPTPLGYNSSGFGRPECTPNNTGFLCGNCKYTSSTR